MLVLDKYSKDLAGSPWLALSYISSAPPLEAINFARLPQKHDNRPQRHHFSLFSQDFQCAIIKDNEKK